MRLSRSQLRRIISEALFKEETKKALMNMIDMSWQRFWSNDADERKVCLNEHISTCEKIAIINDLTRDVEAYWEDIKGSAKDMPWSDWLWSGWELSLIHIWRCRRLLTWRSRWSPDQ